MLLQTMMALWHYLMIHSSLLERSYREKELHFTPVISVRLAHTCQCTSCKLQNADYYMVSYPFAQQNQNLLEDNAVIISGAQFPF